MSNEKACPICAARRCALCDEWYDPLGGRAAIHDHPEPQSGLARRAWLRSGLDYTRWVAETAQGRQWAARAREQRNLRGLNDKIIPMVLHEEASDECNSGE